MVFSIEEEVLFESICLNGCVYMNAIFIVVGCRSRDGRWFGFGIDVFLIGFWYFML